ncbi:DUF3270 family protein [Streptococcus merionis]|uniref:Membrane protein n=1 Tax=Streptococcus merionis TaxID=400065 RepID=A0A239SPQ7_9STRE|nr:DUF3270 family protein [Streptococcus merionis]SNU86848.1 membrane protein [Streptococcus merionis]
MALRDYKFDDDKVVQLRPKASYDAYQEPEEEQQSVEDILFFANIAIFAIASVLSIFIFSALRVNTLLSFLLGIGCGVLALQTCRFVLKKYQHKTKSD